MQLARTPDRSEVAPDRVDPLANDPAVGLDLGLARTAEKTVAAALTFKMGPASDRRLR